MRILNTANLPDMNANERHWVYNGLDCCLTAEIGIKLDGYFDDTSRNIYNLSKNLHAPVMEMAIRGILVDRGYKVKVIQDMRQKLHRLEAQFDQIVREGIGVTLNWRSPKGLGELLYDVMGLPVQKKRNANGVFAPTTDRDALEKLSIYFIGEPIISHLLLMRDLAKSIGFLETPLDADGRMRTSINIAGTNTGRLASAMSDFGTGTNLQNVARTLRTVFIADKGMKFANLDLEQADSRNIGAWCWNLFAESHGEAFAGAYLDTCESGDLHTNVCKLCNPHLFVEGDERSDREIADQIFYRDKSYRDGSKVLGHGSNYLGTPPTMAKHSKFPVQLVREFQQKYFSAFAAIPLYHDWVRQQLSTVSYITTLFGRRRFFFGRPSEASTQREAVAFGGQSMTAEEINIGLLNLWRENIKHGWGIQLLIQVHDSILFQFPEEREDEIVPKALQALRAPLVLARGREFVVPTEAKTGWNWGDYSDTNEDGLKKYRGGDTRKRQRKPTGLDIRGL